MPMGVLGRLDFMVPADRATEPLIILYLVFGGCGGCAAHLRIRSMDVDRTYS